MNSWNFTGNSGRDAEVRFLPTGDAITTFSVAVKAGYGKNEVTSWVNCSYFGKGGQAVAQYIKKGTALGVTGEALLRSWDNKEGVKQSSLECRVNSLTLLGSKRDDETAKPSAPSATNNGTGASSFDDFEDDIPFNSAER